MHALIMNERLVDKQMVQQIQAKRAGDQHTLI
jgi:hypothetical protein